MMFISHCTATSSSFITLLIAVLFLVYSGRNCEHKKNECSSNPCHNAGTCVNDINRFTCLCKDGYTGKYYTYVFSSELTSMWRGVFLSQVLLLKVLPPGECDDDNCMCKRECWRVGDY